MKCFPPTLWTKLRKKASLESDALDSEKLSIKKNFFYPPSSLEVILLRLFVSCRIPSWIGLEASPPSSKGVIGSLLRSISAGGSQFGNLRCVCREKVWSLYFGWFFLGWYKKYIWSFFRIWSNKTKCNFTSKQKIYLYNDIFPGSVKVFCDILAFRFFNTLPVSSVIRLLVRKRFFGYAGQNRVSAESKT